MSSSNGNAGKKPAASGGRGGIRTLADINRAPSGFPGAGGSGSDSDEPQEYYTGGEKRFSRFSAILSCILTRAPELEHLKTAGDVYILQDELH